MPTIFIPARNSRHRTACFALYRALIRQSVRVPLPDKLISAPGLTGPIHPIKHLVRKSFRRNKTDTSPRLVISALRNGYKFLDMLSAAQSPSTPEYARVHEFIRARQARKTFALSLHSLRSPPPPKPSSAPNPTTIPLLTRVSRLNEPPRYEPTIRPRPLSELGGTGIRRVPVLELAAGIPYLRQTKPQTLIMNRIIRQKSEDMQEKVTEAMEMLEHPLEAAKWEDAWDDLMEERLGVQPDPRGLFRDSTQKSMNFVFDRLSEKRVDSYARGAALQRLVEEERALRDKERVERREARRREREARKAGGGDAVPAAESSSGDASVGVTPQTGGETESPESSIERARRLASQVAQSDPFVDPARAEVLDRTTKEAGMAGKETIPSSHINPAPTTKAKTKKFTAIKRIAGDSTLGSTSALGGKEEGSEPRAESGKTQRKPRSRKTVDEAEDHKPQTS